MMDSTRTAAVLGAGFIGLNLVQRLVHAGVTVAVLDHNEAPAELAGRVRWVRGEFADPIAAEQVIAGADVAFHLISSTVPGDEDVDVSRELSDNIFATLRFLEVCRRLAVPRVVFASSSSVYGLQARVPIAETAVTDPISSHGIQKLAIEKYLLLHRFHHGLDVRIARLSNPFGPGQRLYGRQGFVALTIGHLLSDEPILLRDGGRPVRDFLYIDDVSEALDRLASQHEAPSVVNIGSGVGHSLQDVVAMIEQAIERPIRSVPGELRRADIPVSILDVTRAAAEIGFRATTPMRSGLMRTLRHYGLATPSA
ncbi:MAG TPA: NAD-dependent epimerase/dehydratase family protein [Steroidobacteraceae bacterium]|jgi:UDP-glucose 4-epimerase|nr:NAD-dependent epimerase/dehydratase family protein [Steroidobacteraceae bacterium]